MNINQEFWQRLDEVRTGLIMIGDRHLPMSHQVLQGRDALFFITADGTDASNAANDAGLLHYLVSSDSEGLYADIVGRLSHESDPDTLDRVWSTVAAAWFDGNRDDPDIRLLRLQPETAEVWLTTSNPMTFLYEVAKGNLTSAKPDLGVHGSLTFD